jgi:hypothetical protein
MNEETERDERKCEREEEVVRDAMFKEGNKSFPALKATNSAYSSSR